MSTNTQFAPTGWSTRLPTEDYLFDQIKLTIEHSWHNQLSRSDIETWLANFTGEVYPKKYEQRLALWLLTNFVYYNEHELRHLCRELFRKFVHDLTQRTDSDLEQLISLIPSAISHTRFQPLGRPGESGAFVLYFFRQENNLAVSVFGSSQDESSVADNLVLVDDVTISGNQAIAYIEDVRKESHRYEQMYLLTLLATQDAIDRLAHLGVTVIHCITLDPRSRAFESESSSFQEFATDLGPCREIAEAYGARLYPAHPLGYQCGQYLFGFYHNTPNNTLPIFWSEASNWKPIFSRYHKAKHGTFFNDLGRFV